MDESWGFVQIFGHDAKALPHGAANGRVRGDMRVFERDGAGGTLSAGEFFFDN